MLHVDPEMITRLEEIHTDLLTRRAQAEAQGWLGEIDGLDLTLQFLNDKRAETRRLAGLITQTPTPTLLGMPTMGAPG